jgi:hypothetical protein
MGTAERIEEVDAFHAVDVHLVGMRRRLTSQELMGAQYSELESYVIKEGLELQRLLLEAHMELRAASIPCRPIHARPRRAAAGTLMEANGRRGPEPMRRPRSTASTPEGAQQARVGDRGRSRESHHR